jgi:molybdenum cofactor cytidylyltransferase
MHRASESSADDSARVAGIVLAAGASRRMGHASNKLVLDVGGEPMVRRTVRRAIEARLDPVVVVTGHQPTRIRAALGGLECTFVENPAYSGPTSGSLHAGLRALDTSVCAAVVMLGDMVHVGSAMLVALVERFRDSGARLAVSRYGEEGVLAPPLLFRRELWPELLAWSGEGCGKAVVIAHLDEAVLLDWPAEALRDIDTPEDYEEELRGSGIGNRE